MANKTRTYKPTDWSLWVDSPDDGTFVLDVSLLDGPDVLGTTAGSMRKIDAEISQITLREGGDSSYDIIYSPTPPSLTATLSVKNFVVQDIRNYFIGKTIWLTLKNEQTYADPVYGTNTPYFFGIIRDFQVTVTPGSDFSVIELSASSKITDWLNTMVTVNKTLGLNKATLIDTASNALGMDIKLIDAYSFGLTEAETKTLGDWSYDVLLDGAGQTLPTTYYNPNPTVNGANYDFNWQERYLFVPFPSNLPPGFPTDKITSIEFGWHNNSSPTSVKLTDTYDDSIVVSVSESLSTTQKQIGLESIVDVNGSTNMTTMANVLVSYDKRYLPISLTTINVESNQNITFEDKIISTWHYWTNPIASQNSYSIAQRIELSLPEFGVGTIYPVITGRTIEIDTERWTTTYDLWIG